MEWLFSQDLNNLGTLPAVLLIGLALVLIFGGIGLLRRALTSVFNVAYSVAMVSAVYLSVAVLAPDVPAPENWLTFLLLTVSIGLLLNYEPVSAPILATVRWALLLVTIPVLTYFILFDLLFVDATTLSIEGRLIASLSSLIVLFFLALAARALSTRLLRKPAQPATVDSRSTREPDQTVLLADQGREPQPSMLPALVIAENALVYPTPGGSPVRRLNQGRQVVVIARDPSGQWLKLRHKEALWMQRSALQIQGDPRYLRQLKG